MEHLSNIVTRSLNGSGAPRIADGNVRAALARTPVRLADLTARFRASEALDNEDVVLPLSSLSYTESGLVRVPSLGDFALNEWSKKQLASLLGVKWDVWFHNTFPRERAEEVNRRLAFGPSMRIRTRKHEAPTDDGSAGILRALVSETYTPIPDVEIGEVLQTALAAVAPDCAVFRTDLTERTTSYVVTVGRPYRPGESAEVGEVWGGLLVRNSGVGFASLAVSLHLTRLLCLNGMTAPVPDPLVMKRRHRHLDRDAIYEQLLRGLEDLPGRLHRGMGRMKSAREILVTEPLPEVHRILEGAHLPRRLTAPILAAYEAEPHRSAFGVVQAITLAAQSMTPEVRVELEHAAGRYLVEQVP